MCISSADQPPIVTGRGVGKPTLARSGAQSRRAFVSIPIHQQGSEAMYFGIGGLILLIIILVILFS
jgi:hypothetical protein